MASREIGPACLTVQVFCDHLRKAVSPEYLGPTIQSLVKEGLLPGLLCDTRESLKARQEYLDAKAPGLFKGQYDKLAKNLGYSPARHPELDFHSPSVAQPKLLQAPDPEPEEDAPLVEVSTDTADDPTEDISLEEEDSDARALVDRLNATVDREIESILRSTLGLKLVLIPIVNVDGQVYMAVLTARGRITRKNLEYHLTFTESKRDRLQDVPADILLRDPWTNIAGKKYDLCDMGIVPEIEDRVVWSQFIIHQPGIEFRSWFHAITSSFKRDLAKYRARWLLTSPAPYVMSKGGPWKVLVVRPVVKAVTP